MTTIKKCLATVNDKPAATVILDFNRRKKLVEVRLEGVILSEHIETLRDFLKNVSYFPGNKWILQLEDLEVISLRALRVLVKFAKVIRAKQGCEVEIKSIQPSVLAALRELDLCGYFQEEFTQLVVQLPCGHNMMGRRASGNARAQVVLKKDGANPVNNSKNKKGCRHDESRIQQFQPENVGECVPLRRDLRRFHLPRAVDWLR